ncbi:MAG TPA: YezD family protein [Methylophilus sp.]
MHISTLNTAESEQAVFAKIVEAITLVQQQSGFGSIEITVHDGRVTQIERREKVRFEAKPSALKK